MFWPEEGYTKGDLIEYYRAISPWLLPYLKDRLLVLTRFPDGIKVDSRGRVYASAFSGVLVHSPDGDLIVDDWLFLFGDSNLNGAEYQHEHGWLDLPDRVHLHRAGRDPPSSHACGDTPASD